MIDQGLLGSVSLSIAADILLGGESRGTGYFSILLVLKSQPSPISFSIYLIDFTAPEEDRRRRVFNTAARRLQRGAIL